MTFSSTSRGSSSSGAVKDRSVQNVGASVVTGRPASSGRGHVGLKRGSPQGLGLLQGASDDSGELQKDWDMDRYDGPQQHRHQTVVIIKYYDHL